jgi:hypothetical protein
VFRYLFGKKVSRSTSRRPAPQLGVERLEARDLPATGIGVFISGAAQWFLKNTAQAGAPDLAPFAYGGPGWTPVAGDWDGNGAATVGTVSPDATWYLRNASAAGAPDVAPFRYGAPGWVPLAGDWNGDGQTTVGTFDPTTATWYLKDSNGPGAPSFAPFRFGAPGWVPVVGDWDGNGTTTVGVFDPATATFYLRNSNAPGAPDVAPFRFGGPGWTPVAGDWDGDGRTTIGVLDPNSVWHLRNHNAPGAEDIRPFAYGAPGSQPLVGAWIVPPPAPVAIPTPPAAVTTTLLPQTQAQGSPPPGSTPAQAEPSAVQSSALRPTPTPTPAGPPVLKVSSQTVNPFNTSMLELIGVSSTLALGELTIRNDGPAGSVLHYQISGALSGSYTLNGWVSFTLACSAPVGEVAGGQSTTVYILANSNPFSLAMALSQVGFLRVSDPTGQAAAVTVLLDALPSMKSSWAQTAYINNLINEQSALFGPSWLDGFSSF